MPDPKLRLTNEELLAAYDTLKRHEEAILDLMIDTQAAITALRRSNPQFADTFDDLRTKARAAGLAGRKGQLRLFDATIERLRST